MSGSLRIVGGAFAYNEHRHWKARGAHEWDKLKILTGADFEGKIGDAIKLIDKIVASENDGSYNANESKWAVEVTKFENIFRDFLSKIRVTREIVRGRNLSGNHLTAFASLNKLVEDYYSNSNNLADRFNHISIELTGGYIAAAIDDAKKLQTNLANFKTDFENLKNVLYTL